MIGGCYPPSLVPAGRKKKLFGMVGSMAFKVTLGRNKHRARVLAIIAIALILGLSAHCKKTSTPNTETSVHSKKSAETSESVSTDNEVSARIKQLVRGLEYPDEVAEDFTVMVVGWKDELGRPVLIIWKNRLASAYQDYKQGAITRNQVAKVEESVLAELCRKIKKQFSPKELAFELSDVIEHRQANCLGYSQLVYVSGNAIGLSVKPIDVLEQVVFVEGDAKGGHVACIVELFDGQVVMADVTWFYELSLAFKLKDHLVKARDYWELRDKDNPLLIHRRIRLLDRKGLLAAIYNDRGHVYGSKGEYDRAILECNKAIKIDPEFSNAYNNRGDTYKDKGDLERAILDYTKAIEIDPNYAIAYTNRGNAFDDKGEHDRAITDHTKAIEIDPRFAEAYNNRGVAYANKGEFDRAILDFTKAIEINPKDADAYVNRGGCYCKKDEYDWAILDFDKAIEINPEDAYAYTIRGNIYYVKKECDRAILNYEKAIEIDPEGAMPYRDRGAAYAELGKSEEAKKDLVKALELDPDLRESVKKVSEHYKLGLKLD